MKNKFKNAERTPVTESEKRKIMKIVRNMKLHRSDSWITVVEGFTKGHKRVILINNRKTTKASHFEF